jgi:DNA-binding CsgD family transcriptional regulator
MFAIQDETDLVPAVYDGPFEQPMWQTLLERLRQRTCADTASITFRPPSRPCASPIRLFAGGSADGEGLRLDPDAASPSDPISGNALREERIYALADLLLSDDPVHNRYRREVLDPGHIDALRIVRLTEPGGLAALITLTRAGADFTPADGALLRRIAPHLRRSLRVYAEIERQRAGAQIAAEVMARLNFGWIRLDARGMVLDESAEATKLLQHGAGLKRTRGGQLVARDARIDRRFTAALRAIAEGRSSQSRALNISQDPWVDLLITPATLDPSAPGVAAMVYIQGDNRSLTDRHEQLAELFGLLPSEARFALALSRGLSIAEAASQLGLTIETARNYSKKVYAKTGARGQADLVRFILTSVLALA